MTPDEYLQRILNREAVDTGPYSPVRGVHTTLDPIIRGWAGNRLLSMDPSGSFMKGTANKSGTDIDLFISLSEQATETLKEIYDKLFGRMKERDLCPAGRTCRSISGKRLFGGLGPRQASGTATATIQSLPAQGRAPGQQNERRNPRQPRGPRRAPTRKSHHQAVARSETTRFPVILLGTDSDRCPFTAVFRAPVRQRMEGVSIFARQNSRFARVVDPANTNNVISDDLSSAEKTKIKAAVGRKPGQPRTGARSSRHPRAKARGVLNASRRLE